MNGLNSSLFAASAITVVISAFTVIFPENKYKKHLLLITKIIIIYAVISVFIKSKPIFKSDFDYTDYGYTGSFTTDNLFFSTIENDIKNYVESAFDTNCEVKITESELMITVSSDKTDRIKQAVYEKFGIDCRVVKGEI